MKKRYIIVQAGANNYWSCFKGFKEPYYLQQDGTLGYICNQVDDCFLNGSIKEAKQYDSYDEAKEVVDSFRKIVIQTKIDDKIINTYPGVGVYKIEEVLVCELP